MTKTKDEPFAVRVFSAPNPDGEREFYWITAPHDHTEDELNELVDAQEWHGPFQSEQKALKDARRFLDEDEIALISDTVKVAFQADKSVGGKFVFHALDNGQVIAVITIDHEKTTVQGTVGELPEWMSRQLADAALGIFKQATQRGSDA
jgi:hypothetical protein